MKRLLILRQLTRRLDTLPATAEAQVQALALPELEALGELTTRRSSRKQRF